MEDEAPTPVRSARRRVPPSIAIGSIIFCIMGLRTFGIDRLPTFELLIMDPTAASSSFSTYFGNYSSSFFEWSNAGEEEAYVENPVLQPPKGGKRLSLDDLMSVSASSLAVCEDGTQFVGSSPKKAGDALLSQTRIPQMIHQSHPTYCLPPNLYANAQRWKNSTNDYYFYTAETLQTFFHQDWPEFPHMSQIVSCIASHEGLVTLWKALVLWEFGGLAVDLQVTGDAATGIETAMTAAVKDEAVVFGDKSGVPTHAALAMVRKHPIAYYLVLQILHGIVAFPRTMAEHDWSGTVAVEAAWFSFQGLDVGSVSRPKGNQYSARVHDGRYNRTARYVKGLVVPKSVPQLLLPGRNWNVSCLHFLHSAATMG